MAYRLLGAHVNWTVSELPETIKAWKPPLVVLLDHSDVWHDVKRESPDTVFVGRLVLSQSDEPDFNRPDLDPLRAARHHCDKVLPLAQRMGETYSFWQGVNEPIINSSEAMQRCADFDAERARIMDRNGFRVVVGSFSVGNPKLVYWQQFLPALEAARQYEGALALHEYAWPTLRRGWEWYLLRHRKVYDGEPERGWAGLPEHLKTLPLLITECGLDGLIEKGHPPRGWEVLYGNDPGKYLRQLTWYDGELLKDPYVVGAAIYCLATPDALWKSYDIWPEPAKTLARRASALYRLKGEQPVQPAGPTEPTQPVEPTQPTPAAAARWRMKVEYRPGSQIIAGLLPKAGIELTITDPWGNARTAVSGSKPEHGPGGFEVLAPHAATYTLAFSGKTFEVKTRKRVTFLTFSRVKPPDKPPEEEKPPSGEETEGPPETPPQESPVEPVEKPDPGTLLEQVLQRLDRIVYALRLRLLGSIGSATMGADGTVFLVLRAEGPDGGTLGDARFAHPPGDPQYAGILAHLGGLEPGEEKLVPPWPDEAEEEPEPADQDEPAAPGEPPGLPLIYDRQGQQRDWDWLVANFGPLSLERAEVPEEEGLVFRIVKLQGAEGPAVQVVNVADRDGIPLRDVAVVRYWPDAPELPSWSPPASTWRDRGVYGGTNQNGDIGFGMGHGDYYHPPDSGASAVWVAAENGPSDLLDGLGMLGGTNHRHLEVYYQLQKSVDPSLPPPPSPLPPPPPPSPPPPPPVGDWDALFERLDRIADVLER